MVTPKRLTTTSLSALFFFSFFFFFPPTFEIYHAAERSPGSGAGLPISQGSERLEREAVGLAYFSWREKKILILPRILPQSFEKKKIGLWTRVIVFSFSLRVQFKPEEPPFRTSPSHSYFPLIPTCDQDPPPTPGKHSTRCVVATSRPSKIKSPRSRPSIEFSRSSSSSLSHCRTMERPTRPGSRVFGRGDEMRSPNGTLPLKRSMARKPLARGAGPAWGRGDPPPLEPPPLFSPARPD